MRDPEILDGSYHWTGHRLICIRRLSYEYCTCTKSHCTAGTRPRIRIKCTDEFQEVLRYDLEMHQIEE